MPKISARALEETITTSGYEYDTNGTSMYFIWTPTHQLAASGTLTSTGRLDIAIPTLKRIAHTLTELGTALDELKEQP